ncbi:hypothetical protein DFQ30_005815, partial [Apophysomyces sp. BC1015]
MESARRLAVFAWAQARQQDEDAKDFAVKALKLPASLKHLETKESKRREAFSADFIEQYNEANFQQRLLRAAVSGNTYGTRGGFNRYGNQQQRGYSQRGKNFFGGKARGNQTS